jgi:hypothetical protein
MKMPLGRNHSLLETIMALIGQSPIVVAKPLANLPAGFTEVDVMVLDWIAAEGRRIRADYALH